MLLLELHDSHLLEITTDNDGAHLRVLAHVDDWHHDGNDWNGVRCRREVRISISGVVGPDATVPDLPCLISGGSLAVGTQLLPNRIPFPNTYKDLATLRLECGDKTLIFKAGRSVTLIGVGDAAFVENLDSSRFAPPALEPPRDELSGVASFPLEGLGSSLIWLEEHLKTLDIRLHPKSALAREMAELRLHKEEVAATRMITRASFEDAMDHFTRVRGIDFMSKAIHLGYSAGLRPPIELWKSIAAGEPNVFASGASTGDRNFSWEFLIASITQCFASDVTFEEPDIACSYTGRRIEVAAKVAYSRGRLWKNVDKGLTQSSSKADVHFVFVNVVSLLDRVDLLRRTKLIGFQDNESLVAYLQAWATDWCNNSGLAEAVRSVRSTATRPTTVAFFMPCIVGIGQEFQLAPLIHLPITTDRLDHEFALAFQQTCNRVWGGVRFARDPQQG